MSVHKYFIPDIVQMKIQNLNSQVITSQVTDTYHDSLHKDNSAGGLVASVNKNFTRFVSSAHIHDRISEMTDHMVPVQDDIWELFGLAGRDVF